MTISRFLREHWFASGLAVTFVLPWIVFGHSLSQDFAAIDDAFLIVQNPIVHGLDWWHIHLAFTTFDPELYIPLTLLTFQMNWVLGAGGPFLFHVTNLLLQSINAVLVGALLLSWTRRRTLALAGALLFAIHPVHTEAVVWAAGRKDLLCTTFLLLSYLGFRLWTSSQHVLPLTLSIIAFVLSLLSKALAVTLPAVLLLDLLLLHRRGSSQADQRAGKTAPVDTAHAAIFESPLRQFPKQSRSTWVSLIPFAALSALFLWIASFGKEQILASSTLWETIVMAQKSAAFYLGKFMLPTSLTVIYPFQGTLSLTKSEFFLSMLLHVSLIAIALWQWLKRPLVSFGILFYYVTLSPTFFNFHKGDLLFFAVDRYAYVPSMGFLLATLSLGAELLSWIRATSAVRWSLLAGLIMIFGAVSVHQTSFWDTPDSLFGRSIALYPESASARMAMGSILRERNDLEGAFQVLRDGARYSDHPGLNIEAGLVYSAAGQVADAREQFQMALKKSPTLAPAEFYLGFLDEHDGNEAGAESWYRRAIDHDPSYVTVRVHLTRLLIARKEFAEARQQLSEALKWNPVSIEALEARVDLAKAMNDASSVSQWSSVLAKAKAGGV